MTENPLWLVFMITAVIFAYLSMNISVDHETNEKSPKIRLLISLAVAALISIAVGIGVSLTDGFGPINGIVLGGIIFICFLAPTLYIYYLRMKREE